ncbi:MAG TPA: acyl-CoA dehydrogenase family protein, partial [Pseudogracilibacillus sp.]|nr:acyl-CoA dehydrogenase family protein [Pseudogracilibacillus sp.]
VTEHTAHRQAFGQTIAKFQGVSFRVSQMVIETNVVKNLIWQAASAVDEGEEEAHSLVLSAIHRAHKGVQYVTDSAVQLLGGHGFVQDYPVEKWMRDAQAQVLLYGNEQMFLNQRGHELISMAKTEVEV